MKFVVMRQTRRAFLAATLLMLLLASASADDWPQWRGPTRDGISREKSLLKEWPKEGPKLVWTIKDAGSGYGAPSVVGERLYLLGNQGLDNEFVEALSIVDGKTVWKTTMGKVGNPEQQPNFPAARSTPTVDGTRIFAFGSDGDLACLERETGKIVWQKNVRKEFGGKPGTWAYAESPLVDGDKVICTPGGSESTMVALNKANGEVMWKCPIPEPNDAAYSSAIIVNAVGQKQYVQLIQKGLVGVDADSGKLLWRYNKTSQGSPAVIPTPVAFHEYIFSAGARAGASLTKLEKEGEQIVPKELYFSTKLPTAIGGSLKAGDFLYGTTGQGLMCLEFLTGDVKWQEKSVGAGSLCLADGRLYVHGEGGEVGLIEAIPEGYREKGMFNPPDQPKHSNQMEKAWAYPVVANGKLYIRDHGTVWCYDVAQ